MTADAVGGVWTYSMALSRELSRLGADIVLAVMGPAPGEEQRVEASGISRLTLLSGDFKLEWMQSPWIDVAYAGDWLLALAAEHGADVVHLNGYAHAALPWRQPVLVAAHSCVSSWWRAVHSCEPPPEWDAYRYSVAAGLAAADHVVAPTQAFLDDLRRCYKMTTPASVIHNGRAPAPFAYSAEAPRDPLIFASGRLWDKAKNMSMLDEAVRGLPWRTYAAGAVHSPDGECFRANGMELLGRVPEYGLASWLKAAGVYAHPAAYEPFGLSVLEAALSGCALVLADLPTLRELWDGAALFAGARDAAAFRRQLERVIADPTLRLQLARAASKRTAHFDPQRMGRNYLDLYAALLARGRKQERAVA